MHLDTALASIEDFYRRIYWQAPEATTFSTSGYTLTYSGVGWMHSLNQLWLHRIDALNDRLLAIAADFFSPYDADYSIVFTAADRPAIFMWLADHQFAEWANSPIYALHGLPRPSYQNREIKILQATASHYADLHDVLYRTFFMGPEVGHAMVRPEHFGDPTIRHYLAYLEGEAAGCTTILMKERVASVWNVGTLRNFRRQGVASSLLMHALIDATDAGCPNSVLMASPMGRSLYEQMGYSLIGTTYYFGLIE